MAQTYRELLGTDTVKDSRQYINDNTATVASCFSGTAFPTSNLFVGMLCFRTDQAKLYQYTAADTWSLIIDFSGSDGGVVANAVNAALSAKATKLENARTIALSGGATGTATSFDGTGDIIIPVTSLDATKLSGTASINTTGNASTATTATNADNATNATYAVTAGNSDTVDGKHASDFLQLSNGYVTIPSIDNDSYAATNMYPSKLYLVKANPSIAPNNGVILVYGNYDACQGQLWIGDNGYGGIAFRGKSNGVMSTWHKILMSDSTETSNNTNGYAYVNNGILLQWGTYSTTSGSSYTVGFPIAFSSTPYVVGCSYKYNGRLNDSIGHCNTYCDNASNFRLWSEYSCPVYWWAIGV